MQSRPVNTIIFMLIFMAFGIVGHTQGLSDSLILWQQNQNTQAISRIADRVLRGEEKKLSQCLKTEFLTAASRVEIDKFNPTKALYYAREAQKNRCTDSSLVFQAIMREANACNLLERIDSAVLLTRQVIVYAEVHADEDLLFSAFTNLGSMLNKQKAFSDAQKTYQKAMELAKKQNNYRNIAVAFLNISLCHLNLKTYDQGLTTIDSALWYGKQANIMPILGHAMGLKSELYLSKQDTSNWLRTLDSAIDIAMKIGNFNQAAYGLNDKVDYYLEEKDYPQAIFYGKKVLAILEGGDQYQVLENAYHNFYTAYKGIDDFRSALHYLEKYTALKDSLNQAGHAEQVQELNLKFKIAEHKNVLKQKQLEIKKQRIWLLSSLLAALVLGGASFFFAWRTRSHRSTIRRLFLKEREMEKELSGLRKLLPRMHLEQPVEERSLENSPDPVKELAITIRQIVEERKLFLHADFSREKLLQLLGTNRKYLTEAINELSPEGLRIFINKYRIQTAKELLWKIALKESDCVPQTVWQQSGFNSIQTYYRTFKSFTDLTPGEYLEQVLIELKEKNSQNKRNPSLEED